MRPEILGLLEDIHEAIGFVNEDTTAITFEAFMNDRRRRQAVERNFEIMGEAMNRLFRHAPDIAERITAARQIVAFRNAIIHGYDMIEYPNVWQIVHESLPVLRREIEHILSEANGSAS